MKILYFLKTFFLFVAKKKVKTVHYKQNRQKENLLVQNVCFHKNFKINTKHYFQI